ncbi:hypothetical protein JCM24511_04819 [Saitozyma sp. JCM 24511]|nr:hypothetical protein JCM24511_04819 [Saitozyma sp. JCM 24511]
MSAAPSTAPKPLPLLDSETDVEFKKMLEGKPHTGSDPYLSRLRDTYEQRVARFNAEPNPDVRNKMLGDFLTFTGSKEKAYVGPHFVCEYGFNVRLGEDVSIGPSCHFADVMPITIGSRTMFGPHCQLYTPCHPLSPEERNGTSGPEWAEPITIGNDCWIGGGVIICPGVTIGDGVTVGAGSVVTKDVESRSVVVGNPARVVKKV